jgi:DNA-binding transcriptional MocR family regulator
LARESYLIVTKELAADKRVSLTARVLFAQLLDHRNRRTGQCNPWEATLADEIGVSRWTVMRRLAELEKAGMVEVKRTPKGNRYEFPKLQSATSPSSNLPLPKSQSATSGASGPLYELNLKEPNARARKRAAGSPSTNNSYSTAAAPRKPPSSAVLEIYYAEERRKAGKQ